jgi:hypothetical protein
MLGYLAAIETDPEGVAAILGRCKPPAKARRRDSKAEVDALVKATTNAGYPSAPKS